MQHLHFHCWIGPCNHFLHFVNKCCQSSWWHCLEAEPWRLYLNSFLKCVTTHLSCYISLSGGGFKLRLVTMFLQLADLIKQKIEEKPKWKTSLLVSPPLTITESLAVVMLEFWCSLEPKNVKHGTTLPLSRICMLLS